MRRRVVAGHRPGDAGPCRGAGRCLAAAVRRGPPGAGLSEGRARGTFSLTRGPTPSPAKCPPSSSRLRDVSRGLFPGSVLAAQPLAADTMAADDLAISVRLMAAALLRLFWCRSGRQTLDRHSRPSKTTRALPWALRIAKIEVDCGRQMICKLPGSQLGQDSSFVAFRR